MCSDVLLKKTCNKRVIMTPKPKESASSESDDGDDEQMRQFLEAADTTLLTNAMFQPSEVHSSIKESVADKVDDPACKQIVPKSNRFLAEDVKAGIDFITTEATRKHIAKKFTELIASCVEFCDFKAPTFAQKPWRSRVKLVTGTDCYVKPYEDFEFDSKGPTKRPIIKRRRVDVQDKEENQEELYKMTIVTADDVFSGKLTTGWASKRDRMGKVFYYKQDDIGNFYMKPELTEFTNIRNKNQWNETKIKQKRNKNSRW